jgi:hypothetical protein
LYSLASYGEYNLVGFLRDRPVIVAHLGVALDLDGDDAEVALQLAPAIGRYKRSTTRAQAGERAGRAAAAVGRPIASARHPIDHVELDADLILGDVLADTEKKYVSFEIAGARVPVHRGALARARAPLRNFMDLAAYVDEGGLHLRWRAGHGGLNFHPQVEERGADVLHIDLRPALPVRRPLPQPLLLAEVLADLALI